MGDNKKGSIRGRIYRVAASGTKYQVTAPNFKTADSCAAALLSPNNSTRYVAWTKLHAMGAKAEGALRNLWSSANPRYRARALHLLLRTPGNFQPVLEQALSDDDADVRACAVRELRLAVANRTLPAAIGEPAAWMLPRINTETSKQVLREYALTLHVVKDPDKAMPSSADADAKEQGAKKNAKEKPVDSFTAAWTALARKHDGHDRWYLEALGLGSTGREDRVFSAWLASVKGEWNTPAGRDIVWRVRSPMAFDPLTKLLTNRKAPADTLPRYLREFDFLPDGDFKNAALLKVATASTNRVALESDVLQRLGRTELKDAPAVKRLLNIALSNSKGTPAYLELVQAYGLTDRLPTVLDEALADPKSTGARDAIKFLISQQQEGMSLLRSAMATPKAEKLVTLLGGNPDRHAQALLSGAIINEKSSEPVRRAAVRALALNAAGALELVALAESGKMPAELKPVAQSALAMVQYPGISEKIAAVFPPAQAAGGKTLPPIPELMKMKGDVAKGRAIFARAESSCTLCHRVGQVGVDFAPALTEIGSKLGKDAIFDAILNPNAGISMGFETTDLKLKNGTSALGIVRSDTGEQLVLALPGGVTNTFPKNQIVTRTKLAISMMPTGLQSLFSQEDLVNLVEYLFSLKSPQARMAAKN
jgi:putative heme-binding domain-containing protein